MLNVETGEPFWTFSAEAAIKSSPCCDDRTGFVLVGSHDRRCYALDVAERRVVWSHQCKGSIFSSPCVSRNPHCVIIASLAGVVTALHPVTGDVTWRAHLPKPVFSSPVCDELRVYVGCVDGCMYALHLADGSIVSVDFNSPEMRIYHAS